MKSVMNKNVLITGGAMGMGKAYAIRAINDGAKNVVIWDMNEEAMAATKKELSNERTAIHTFKVDVTDTDLVYTTAQEVVDTIGPIELLINNAGIVVSEFFINHDPKKIDLSMQINSVAPMHITRAFLPAMAETSDAHIVNISSGAGLMYCPRILVYCASKWAILGWSHGLRVELKETLPHINVTTVTPGHIDTGMFDGAHSNLLPLVSVDKMVDAVWSGIKRNKAVVARPRAVAALPLVRGLLGLKGFEWLLKVTGTNEFMAGHDDKRK